MSADDRKRCTFTRQQHQMFAGEIAARGCSCTTTEPEDGCDSEEKDCEPDAPPLLKKTADTMSFDELQQYKKHLQLLAEVRQLEKFTGFAAGQNGRRSK